MKKLLIPYTFTLLNWAAIAGLFHFLLGHRDLWLHYREMTRRFGDSLHEGHR